MENLSGHIIKGYELRERIGAGGFGAVYRAYQSSVGREVAVKIILPGFANHPDFIRRFETEAQLVARLEHMHIIPLYDFWRDPDGAYLVMRWLRGGCLRDALQNGPFDLQASVLLFDQITSALIVAHRNNVIHRDLKPPNILMDEDGNAYLADFGIAKDISNLKSNITQADAIIGSPDYLSPEQARSEPVTPQTDIYSLGVMLYEVLTGHHPFPNLTPVERLYKHLNDPLPHIATLLPEVQDGVNAVIQKATAKNPAHRFSDVLELATAFRQAAALQRENGDRTVETMTQREQEVLQGIIDGRSNKEIASDLFVTVATVRWYVKQIYAKLNVHSRVQAIIRARELHLVVSRGDYHTMDGSETSLSELAEAQNPYKGLRAFHAADTRDFFGRESLTQKLIKRLNESGNMSRFLAVIGPSGSGKSSLVKAGLIPALWRGELPNSERWFVVEMLPGSHPLDELEVALTRVAASHSGDLGEHLHRDARGLLRVAGLILPDDGSELVLVIDQFEEVFTLVEDETVRVQFLDLIYTAVTDPRSRLRVIITLRADFYDRPLHYPDFGELIQSRMETILPLTAEGLEQAIARPAEQLGMTFEPGLVASIIGEVNYQPGALPLLQYALTELFEQRNGRILTREAYQTIGGTVGALARRADEIYGELGVGGQEAARQMFLRLVTLGEGVEDTRRRVPRSELMAIATDEDLMDEVIDTYASYRLLSLDRDPGTRSPTVEVAHEAILREWKRLREWLNTSRDEIRMQRQLTALAAEWWEAKQDSSFLLQGSRLELFEKWTTETQLAMTQKEREYLAISLAERKQREITEKERQTREIRLEKRSRNFLRGMVAVFAGAAVIAVGLSLLALSLRNEAERNAAGFRSIALSSAAQQALDNGNPDVALAFAREAVNMDPPPLQAELAFFNAASSTWIQHRYRVSDTPVWDAVYLPDGERIITTSWDGRAIVWDIKTGQQLQSISRDGLPTNIGIHPDGNIVAIGGDRGLVQLWNLETNEVTSLIAADGWHNAPVFTQDGTQMVTGSDGTTINIWDMESSEIIRSFPAHNADWIASVGLSPDERLIVTAAQDSFVKIWDFETGDLIQTLDHHNLISDANPWMWNAQFLPDGERILTVGGTAVWLWDWRTGNVIWKIEDTTGVGVQDIALSPDSQTFVVGFGDPFPKAQLHDVETGDLIRVYEGHKLRVQQVDFSPDGTTILTGSTDGTAVVWPVYWEGMLSTVRANAPVDIVWHPTRPVVAVVEAGDGMIRVMDIRTDELIHMLEGHRENAYTVDALAFTPDGRYLLSADVSQLTSDVNVYVWDIETGEKVFVMDGAASASGDIAVSPDSHIAAMGEANNTHIVLWNLATGQQLRTLEGHSDAVYTVQFSADGQYLYSGGRDGSLFQWDVQTGTIIREFKRHTHSLFDLDINTDGTRLVFASPDQTAIVLDTVTGKPLLTLHGHTGAIFDSQFSPDNTQIITTSSDGKIILWDAETGAVNRTYVFANKNDFVREDYMRAIFSPDGRYIISGTPSNNQLILWDASPLSENFDTWIENNRYIPDFTCDQRQLYQIKPLCEVNS